MFARFRWIFVGFVTIFQFLYFFPPVEPVDTVDIVYTVDTLGNVKSVNSVDNVSSVNSVHNVHKNWKMPRNGQISNEIGRKFVNLEPDGSGEPF